MPVDERRTGPPSRREDDLDSLVGWRLSALEGRVDDLEDEMKPGQLDRRYAPRPELARDFVPRTEHQAKRDWTLRLMGFVLVVIQGLEALLLARGGR